MRSFCPCTEIDYECDIGYTRTEQGTCIQDPNVEKIKDGLDEDQMAMCDSFGYYTISQGYRKIPGNRCMGGMDLNPFVYSCSGLGGLFTFRNILIMAIIVIMLYFGWPIIEAILVMLPLPDPKDIKEKLKGLVSKSSATSQPGKKPAVGKQSGYTGNFN